MKIESKAEWFEPDSAQPAPEIRLPQTGASYNPTIAGCNVISGYQ